MTIGVQSLHGERPIFRTRSEARKAIRPKMIAAEGRIALRGIGSAMSSET